MTILLILNKHKGKPVVSHTITRAVAQSPEIHFRNAATRAQRIEWGWDDKKILDELQQELQTQVTLSLGKLKRKGFVERVRIERGAKLKEQIKKIGMVFDDPKQLTLCIVAYRITKAGIKQASAEKA